MRIASSRFNAGLGRKALHLRTQEQKPSHEEAKRINPDRRREEYPVSMVGIAGKEREDKVS